MQKEIELTGSDGTYSVLAEVQGDFALHPTHYEDGLSKTRWTVTHVPSGLYIHAGITDFFAAVDLFHRVDNCNLNNFLPSELVNTARAGDVIVTEKPPKSFVRAVRQWRTKWIEAGVMWHGLEVATNE